MIVQVKDIPVRYDNVTHKVGAELEIEDKYFNEALFVYIADSEAPTGNAVKTLDEMTTAELEAYASEKEIDLSGCANKGEKLAKIKEFESGE